MVRTLRRPVERAETFRHAPDGRLREIGKKPSALSDIEGQYMGLLRFTPAGWKAIEAHLEGRNIDRLDTTSLLNGLLEAGIRVAAVPIAGGWFEVDSARDLEVATRGWARRAHAS